MYQAQPVTGEGPGKAVPFLKIIVYRYTVSFK